MAQINGYTGDYNYSAYTPADNTGYFDIFRSGYKNIRFNVQSNTQITLNSSQAANLPGLAYTLLGDTSLWRALLAFNGLSDPLSDVVVGLTLMVPTKAQIQAYLARQNSQGSTTLTI